MEKEATCLTAAQFNKHSCREVFLRWQHEWQQTRQSLTSESAFAEPECKLRIFWAQHPWWFCLFSLHLLRHKSACELTVPHWDKAHIQETHSIQLLLHLSVFDILGDLRLRELHL